ncbi:MAG: ATP-dependent metallopeptidase FtsH/Yme1/Tma family protein, partial [Actinobacteria bacterium]|nr:ATP-dependent metallopeptidase FtsH/Yme1/Tma family protein [Actinomycetota bacterium]
MNKLAKFLRSAAFPILIVVLLAFFVMQIVNNRDSGSSDMSFGEFVGKVQAHDVKSVDVNQNDHNLTVVLVGNTGHKYNVGYTDDYPLTQLLIDNNVSTTIEGTGSSIWSSLLVSALPIVIIVIFWLFLMNQMQGGGTKVMSFG